MIMSMLKKKRKTNFTKSLEIDANLDDRALEDLKMERMLAKKLKTKNGKLRGIDDGINKLIDYLPVVSSEISSAMEKSDSDENTKRSDVEEEKMDEPATNAKYIVPQSRTKSEDNTHFRKRVRGLLNKLSVSNVELITTEILTLFGNLSRCVSIDIISEEVLAACRNAPCGNEQYASAFASFVGGIACSVGMDFSSKLLCSLAKSFQDEHQKSDNLSLRNLTLLLSHLCLFGVCASDLIYDFITVLSEELQEIDVSTILTVLNCCGMKIRGDDPTAMRNFLQNVQNRLKELNSKPNANGKRMEFMIETILDIKNNKKRNDEVGQYTGLKKWLQKLGMENTMVRGLKWRMLLDEEKEGKWWLTGDTSSNIEKLETIVNSIDKEALEAQKVVKLAAAQKMNTATRRAIFCIIMSAEDYLDAFEKLLRLDLQGNQDRDIMRVLMECCLQEKVFNKYYAVLASKLCDHQKNHKFTLQYCIWDKIKEIETMPLTKSLNLAKFVVEIVCSFTLSLSLLKTVDLADSTRLSARKAMHFRMLFEFLFEKSDALLWNLFTRVALASDLDHLRCGIHLFLNHNFPVSNPVFYAKFQLAKRALNNSSGVLM